MDQPALPLHVRALDENRSAPPERLSLTRKQLYDMVWSTPMLQLARTFQCSSTWLARICRESAVPVPPRGYWAQKRAGKAARRQPLRRSADPDEVVISYTPPDEKNEAPAPPPPPPPPPLDEDLAARSWGPRSSRRVRSSIATAFERLHPVVARTGRALRQAEKQKHDRHGLLQPHWVHDGCRLGIEASATGIDRAVRLFEGLFVAAEAFGGKVVEKDKSPTVRLLGDKARFHLRERHRMRRPHLQGRVRRGLGRAGAKAICTWRRCSRCSRTMGRHDFFGVVRAVLCPEDETAAEIAIVVADNAHRLGLGRRLMPTLCDALRVRGVTRIHATVLASNAASMRIFHNVAGAVRQTQPSTGVIELAGDLPVAGPPPWPTGP